MKKEEEEEEEEEERNVAFTKLAVNDLFHSNICKALDDGRSIWFLNTVGLPIMYLSLDKISNCRIVIQTVACKGKHALMSA